MVLYAANPVYFDTRDGCTRLGAGLGAMHLFLLIKQILQIPVSLRLHVCIGDKSQRRAVDAVAHILPFLIHSTHLLPLMRWIRCILSS